MSEIRKKRKISDGIRSSTNTQGKKRNVQTTRSFSVSPQGNTSSINKIVKKNAIKKRLIIHNQFDDEPIIKGDTVLHTRKKNSFLNKVFSLLSLNIKLIKIIFFTLLYVGMLFVIFSKIDKTSISINPETKKIHEEGIVTTYLNPRYDQLGFDIISISESRQKEITAATEKKVSEKASGTIKIFNNYSTEPQRLLPETRFESVSGKIFKLGKEGIIIPGKSANQPGTIDAIVYAENAGAEYNIDITDFTIPGFKESGLDKKYSGIYGLSLKNFSGGYIGNRPTIDQQQKEEAIKEIELELQNILIKRLEVEKTEKVILVDNSIQILFKEEIVDNKIAGHAKITQDAQIFALLIEKQQLEKYLRKKYLPDVAEGEVYLKDFENIHFAYKENDVLDFKTLRQISLETSTDSLFIWNIDKDLINESLVGLHKDHVPVLLKEFAEIKHARVDIKPFWRNTISSEVDSIHTEVEISN